MSGIGPPPIGGSGPGGNPTPPGGNPIGPCAHGGIGAPDGDGICGGSGDGTGCCGSPVPGGVGNIVGSHGR
jgi:hypothetical protein